MNEVNEFIDKFKDYFELVEWGHPENDYSKGFVIILNLKRKMRLTQTVFSWGAVKGVIRGNQLVVGPGFLNDIGRILMIIANGMN